MTPISETQGPRVRYGRLRSLLIVLLPAVIATGLWGGAASSADRGDHQPPDSDPGVEIIVNRSVEIPSLSQYKLRTVFGMRLSSWPDGKPVQVFVLPDKHPLHRRFAKQRLGVFPHQLRRAWNNLIYSGLGQAPTVVANEQEMRDRVARTPGAIGYVNAGAIGNVNASATGNVNAGATNYANTDATTGEEHARTRILPIR